MSFKTSSKQKLSNSNVGFSTTVGVASGGTGPTITIVYITDSSYVNLDDTAVSTSGGYIKLIGTGFITGCTVYVNGVSVTTTFVSSTEVRAVIPAIASGTYSLMLFNSANSGAIFASGLTTSGFPTVTTTSYANNSNVVSVQLLAVGDSTLSYSLQSGSTLPTGLTLSSTGLISGTATGITSATVLNFTVLVNDVQLQTVQQAITLSLTFGEDYFKYNTLAIQSDNLSFISDASSNALNITPTSSAKASIFNPFQGTGYYSAQFNGTNDYLSVPANAVFGFGTGDFTVEYWFCQTASTTSEYEIWESQTTNAFCIYKPISAALSFRGYAGTDQTILAAASIPINTWTHIAVSRASGTTKAFVNGAQVLSITDSTNYVTPTAVYTIGGRNAGTNGFPGYISNLRVIKGTALYTAAFTPDIIPLTAVTNTVLLACGNNRFIDSSTTASVITLGNTPKVTQNTPFTLPVNTYGSGYFNGTSDYATVITSLNFGMGTGSYTIEAWVYPIASVGSILETAGGIQIGYQSTSQFGIAQRGVAWKVVGAVPPLNSWSHIAVVRSGTGTNQTAVYVNGVATLGTDAVDYGSVTGTFTVANSNSGAANYWNGYVSNLRVLKGITVYTGNFTPPTMPLATTQSSGTNISAITGTQTNLLTLQTDIPHNNNTYIDESGYNNIITTSGTPAQGTFSPFSPAGWSTYFTAATDYLTTPAITMSATAFTVECWVNTTNKTAYAAICKNGAAADWTASDVYVIGLDASGASIWIYNGTSSISLNGTTTVSDGAWHHIAFVYDGTNYKLYIDGTQNATQVAAAMSQTARVQNIGADIRTTRAWNGYISNFRIVNGTALYTSTFIPSTSALTSVTNTNVILCASNRYKDTSANAGTITVAGTPKIQSFSPFKPNSVYDPTVHGGSTWFSGSDYLAVANTNNLVLTGDFTIEAWVYCNSFATARSIVTLGNEATGRAAILLTTAGQLKFDLFGSTNATTTATVPINSWNHIAVTRSGTTVYTFINGALTGTTTAVSSNFGNTTQYTIGSNGARTGEYMSGHISNLRIVKGSALYTAAFTPSTSLLPRTSSTVLLLNSTAAPIIDASTRSNIQTVGDARISNSTKKYGTGSMYFDGTGDYLSIPTTSLSGDFGTGDFTVEFWMNASAAGTYVAVVGTQSIAGNTTAGMWRVTNRSASANGIYFNYTTGSAFTDLTFSTTNYNDGTWHHVAACRASGTLRMFVDGVSVGTPTAVAQSLTSGQKIYVAYNVQDAQYYTGYVDDLRITKGFARYTANFTPPTATFLTS